jgi:hypothetical protein
LLAAELPHAFWQTRFYDFNVGTKSKCGEKLNYIALQPGVPGKPILPCWGGSRQNVDWYNHPIYGDGAAFVITGTESRGWPQSENNRLPPFATEHKLTLTRSLESQRMGHPAVPLPARNDRVGVRLGLRMVSRHRFLKNIEWNADAMAELPAAIAQPSSGTGAQTAKAEEVLPTTQQVIR